MAGSFVSDIMDGVVVVNADSTITLMNSVAEHLLCVKSFMAVGKKLADLVGQAELLAAFGYAVKPAPDAVPDPWVEPPVPTLSTQ